MYPSPNEAGHKESVRQQAVKMYLDGLNQRQIARLSGVSQGSVSNWARAYAHQLPPTVSQPETPYTRNFIHSPNNQKR